LIDVRTPEEFELGHIEDSINIEWQNIELIEKTSQKDEKIYLYCRSGNRSQKATEILLALGYKDVKNLGGIKEASITIDKKIIK
jgi:Rhodanese-related sulfurtransferase|tara:strand:+ start:890 stop:1141 length:252 start_codon:yes stop_codon:yes gene_type:complete